MNAKMILYVVMVGLIGTSSAVVFSEDYQDGYMAGADLVGGMKRMDGLLDGTLILLTVLDNPTEVPVLDAFLSTFVSGVAERYNTEVAEYNAMVDDINGATRMILGEPVEDDYLLEYQPVYR
jgi:hypothetical protein